MTASEAPPAVPPGFPPLPSPALLCEPRLGETGERETRPGPGESRRSPRSPLSRRRWKDASEATSHGSRPGSGEVRGAWAAGLGCQRRAAAGTRRGRGRLERREERRRGGSGGAGSRHWPVLRCIGSSQRFTPGRIPRPAPRAQSPPDAGRGFLPLPALCPLPLRSVRLLSEIALCHR